MQALRRIIESFLSDLTPTLFIPSFLFSIFLPAACLCASPCSGSHSFNSMIPLLKAYSVLAQPFLFFTPFQDSCPVHLTNRRVHAASGGGGWEKRITPSQTVGGF